MPSSGSGRTRTPRRAGYASAGVRLYLLIDLWASAGPVITLYGEPADDAYQVLQTVQFGDELTLPAPFGLALGTGVFAVG
ncbi:hypothetical protein [Streptomyces sp. YGL11-2]|uniref:hypothetical protein n=1 Tax=Streptomyces sp. YGL11-2 TaxID=3414028 RepID=UPI003CF113EA